MLDTLPLSARLAMWTDLSDWGWAEAVLEGVPMPVSG